MSFLRKRSIAYAIAAFIIISSTVHHQIINTDWPAYRNFMVGTWRQQDSGGYYYRFYDDGTGVRGIYPNLDEPFEWTSSGGNLRMLFADSVTLEEWSAVRRNGEILVLTGAGMPGYELIFYRAD